jgi:hypothetical protein
MKVVACVGSRFLTLEQETLCERLGYGLAQKGYAVRTGGTQGADQAFARGAAMVDPELVTVCLPWAGYERAALPAGVHMEVGVEPVDIELALRFHPMGTKLPKRTQLLMGRNLVILRPATEVVALPRFHNGYAAGGTAHGLSLAARFFKIPVWLPERGRELLSPEQVIPLLRPQ